MPRAPLPPWVVLVGWLGLMAGLGAALRPAPAAALDVTAAARDVAGWQATLASSPTHRPTLWLGADCPCDDASARRLAGWADAAGAEVRVVAGRDGVAIADAEGRLRYIGDAGALVAQCAGARGLAAWWQAPVATPPVTTAPCACRA